MLLLYIIGTVVLYICLRKKWALLLLAPLLFVSAQKSVNPIIDTSCDRVKGVYQRSFPLCWMMSTVGLFKNVSRVHGGTILHPHVAQLVNNWTDDEYLDTIDPGEVSCPIIQPKALRDHLTFAQETLGQLSVQVSNRPMPIYVNGRRTCFSAPKLQSPSFFVPQQGPLLTAETRLLDSPRPTDMELPQFDRHGRIDIDATYDSPIVTDFFNGRRFWHEYPVCIKKFGGYEPTQESLLHQMLNYRTVLRNQDENSNYALSIYSDGPSFYYLRFVEKKLPDEYNGSDFFPFITKEEADMKAFFDQNKSNVIVNYEIRPGSRQISDFNFLFDLWKDALPSYTILGGVLHVGGEDGAHVLHFVTCANTIYFVDSNYKGNYRLEHEGPYIVPVLERYGMQPLAASILLSRKI